MVIYFSLKASIDFLFRINKERQINPRDDTMKWKLLLSPICTPTLYLHKKKKKNDKTENPIKIKKKVT